MVVGGASPAEGAKRRGEGVWAEIERVGQDSRWGQKKSTKTDANVEG